jgi:hypothetical protein
MYLKGVALLLIGAVCNVQEWPASAGGDVKVYAMNPVTDSPWPSWRYSNFISFVSLPSRNQDIASDATQIPARALSLPMHHRSAAMIPLAPFNFPGISLYQLNSPHTPDLAICARTSSLKSGPGLTDPIIIRTLRDL